MREDNWDSKMMYFLCWHGPSARSQTSSLSMMESVQLLPEQVGVGGAVNDSSALSNNASDESISITSRSCIWAGVESVETQRCWENKELAIGTGVEDR